MLNYEVEPELLQPFVPPGVELDDYNGRTFISMVGFMFLNTKVMGVPVPFHRDFEEVNLRFYVRRKADDGWHRGVVFVREIVPKPAVAFVARFFYDEKYVSHPMQHHIIGLPDNELQSLRYDWQRGDEKYAIFAVANGPAAAVEAGSEEEFITQHYWGYTKTKDGGCVEYQVEHPQWTRAWRCHPGEFVGNPQDFYGERFASALWHTPSSSFLIDGSPVTVHRGVRIG